MDQTKTCRICGETKAIADFYKATGAKDGRRGECIPCARVIRRRQYEQTKDEAIARVQRWREQNPERFRAYQAEYRSRPENKRKMRDLYYRRRFGISADDVDDLLALQGGGAPSAGPGRSGRRRCTSTTTTPPARSGACCA